MTEVIENQNTEPKQNIQENIVQPETQVQTTTEPDGDVHWRNFREQRKEERKQLAEKERELKKKNEEAEALKKALESVMAPAHIQQPQQPQYQYDQYAAPQETEEKRILDKVNALLDQKEKEREQKRRQEEIASYPQRLQNNFSDFTQVINTENLDYLEYHYPEVAKAYGMLPDSYEKWEGIYRAAKRFIPNIDREKDMKKMDKNLAKPVAMSRPGMASNTEQAPHIGLSDDQKAKNWERMKKMMKGV
jgi:hypothetical protein